MVFLCNYEIVNKVDEDITELKDLFGLLDYSLNYLKLDNVVFNVIIINNDEIHEINRKYRGVDRATDVISFALEDDKTFEVVETNMRILGDIYISIDKVREQAENYGHSLKRELSFLVVHGLLHLLGYDHMNEEEEKEMFKLQELILDGYGIKR